MGLQSATHAARAYSMSQMIPPDQITIARVAEILEAAFFDVNEVGDGYIDFTRTFKIRLTLPVNARFIMMTAVFDREDGDTAERIRAHCDLVNSDMVGLKAYYTEELDTIFELASFCATGIEGKTLVRLIDEFATMVRAGLDKARDLASGTGEDDADEPPEYLN
ncbi:MAG: hypothetical protein Alpg2KO_05080 [Alphaproteobacteria bacterium]